MVRGEISKPEAVIFIILCLIIMIVTVAQLPPICLKLLPIAAIPFIVYPFTKRFTGWCHICLGIAIAMAPAGGWVAVSGEITLPMILLCTAVALWIGAFDAMYGAQDEKFDKSQKLHSLATEFGARGAFTISAIHCCWRDDESWQSLLYRSRHCSWYIVLSAFDCKALGF